MLSCLSNCVTHTKSLSWASLMVVSGKWAGHLQNQNKTLIFMFMFVSESEGIYDEHVVSCVCRGFGAWAYNEHGTQGLRWLLASSSWWYFSEVRLAKSCLQITQRWFSSWYLVSIRLACLRSGVRGPSVARAQSLELSSIWGIRFSSRCRLYSLIRR